MEDGILHARLETMQSDISRMQATLTAINGSMTSLVRLEEQHNGSAKAIERAFSEISKMATNHQALDSRIDKIEIAMPGLKELRRWVIAGLSIALTMLVGSVVTTTLTANRQQEFMQQLLLKAPNQLTAIKP